MDRCPNCRARYKGKDNSSNSDGENCRRCGMELTWLLNIEENALVLRPTIVKALANGEYARAKKLVQQHQQLINDPLMERLAVFLENRL